MPKPDIDASIRKGLAFLEKQQQADGSFISHSSASPRPFRRVRSWKTTFVPALMLASLAGLEEAAPVRNKLAGFLLGQKDAHWAFNYWARGASEYKSMPYPNDLDDTFCALAGLFLHDPALIDEAVLAQAVKLLLATETAVGGPYRTWLVPPDSDPVWLDVDTAVNSNVAYFLSLTGNRLPKLNGLMGTAIASGTFSSPYYPSVYPFLYYFARAYDGPHKDSLLQKVRRSHTQATTDLDRALSLSARMRLGETRSLNAGIEKLLAGQRSDGSWPAAVFYADPVKNGKPYYNGGSELTTAFVLEALRSYGAGNRSSAGAPARREDSDRYRAEQGRILSMAKKELRPLPADLRRTTFLTLDSLANGGNGREIIGLPGGFNRSLREPLAAGADTLLEKLSLANLYGWSAYTIYDDFLDDEGRPALLPAANAALRRALRCFLEALPDNQPYQDLVHEVFDIIDGANAWELARCRFKLQDDTVIISSLPDYGDLSKLAERSLGHTLAPIAVLSAKGYGAETIAHTREALRCYLIVRQLNDDLHDWQEDLANGHATYVVARVLAEMDVRPGSHSAPDLTAKARPLFWHAALPAICREMRQRIAASRSALDRAGIFTDTTIVGRLLDGLDASVEDTLKQQSQAENFLKHYRRKVVKL